MQLYILRPILAWKSWYDKCFGVVVRAHSEQAARLLASEEHGDEGPDAWVDPKRTSCDVLYQDGTEGVILRDFASA